MHRVCSYGNLKVDEFVGEGAHLVVEAELVLANDVGVEDKVALALLLAIEDDLLVRAGDNVIDIERTTGLDLVSTVSRLWPGGGTASMLTAK